MLLPQCIVCAKEMKGRSDKKFCSIQCKNRYHRNMKMNMQPVLKEIDQILHRNYAICLELAQKSKKARMMIKKIELEKTGFNFNYFTGSYLNSQQKTYHYIYDFRWMQFSTQEVLIVRPAGFTKK